MTQGHYYPATAAAASCPATTFPIPAKIQVKIVVKRKPGAFSLRLSDKVYMALHPSRVYRVRSGPQAYAENLGDFSVTFSAP